MLKASKKGLRWVLFLCMIWSDSVTAEPVYGNGPGFPGNSPFNHGPRKPFRNFMNSILGLTGFRGPKKPAHYSKTHGGPQEASHGPRPGPPPPFVEKPNIGFGSAGIPTGPGGQGSDPYQGLPQYGSPDSAVYDSVGGGNPSEFGIQAHDSVPSSSPYSSPSGPQGAGPPYNSPHPQVSGSPYDIAAGPQYDNALGSQAQIPGGGSSHYAANPQAQLYSDYRDSSPYSAPKSPRPDYLYDEQALTSNHPANGFNEQSSHRGPPQGQSYINNPQSPPYPNTLQGTPYPNRNALQGPLYVKSPQIPAYTNAPPQRAPQTGLKVALPAGQSVYATPSSFPPNVPQRQSIPNKDHNDLYSSIQALPTTSRTPYLVNSAIPDPKENLVFPGEQTPTITEDPVAVYQNINELNELKVQPTPLTNTINFVSEPPGVSAPATTKDGLVEIPVSVSFIDKSQAQYEAQGYGAQEAGASNIVLSNPDQVAHSNSNEDLNSQIYHMVHTVMDNFEVDT